MLPIYSRVTHGTLVEFAHLVLRNAHSFEWTIQGLGMLRLYLGDCARLHIWNMAMCYPNVSMIHNHSWNLRSTVLWGSITNTRYYESRGPGLSYWKRRLLCGVDGHALSDPQAVNLTQGLPEVYFPGNSYGQFAHEIHRSEATKGAVTLMERRADGPMGEADVYWPVDETWGDAKPRSATSDEIDEFVGPALRALEGSKR